MEGTRGKWTDGRNEDLAGRVIHLEQRMDARFDRLEARFDRLQNGFIVTLGTMLAAFVAGQF